MSGRIALFRASTYPGAGSTCWCRRGTSSSPARPACCAARSCHRPRSRSRNGMAAANDSWRSMRRRYARVARVNISSSSRSAGRWRFSPCLAVLLVMSHLGCGCSAQAGRAGRTRHVTAAPVLTPRTEWRGPYRAPNIVDKDFDMSVGANMLKASIAASETAMRRFRRAALRRQVDRGWRREGRGSRRLGGEAQPRRP